VTNYLLRHLQVLFFSFGQLVRTPLSSALGISVLGIALALPCGLYVLVTNAKSISLQWQGRPQVSLFLNLEITDAQTRALVEQIKKYTEVSEVKYVPAHAALEEFKALSGFGDALEAIGGNPLPSVLIVKPTEDASTPIALQHLVEKLHDSDKVDLAQLDLEWVQRLHAMIRLSQRGVILLAVLLGLAVVVIISNTIRLAIFNRRDEIEIISLIGGTEAFIQRPFLYAGWILGVLGALFALMLVSLSLWLMSGPIEDLAKLYGSNFELKGLGVRPAALLVVIAGTLGWVASRITVGLHLDRLYST